jgi:response regulator RpfG family c-di-GMP phosphodiesterase
MKSHILFVDDEPAVLEGIEVMLYQQRHTWEMRFAASGQEGLGLVRQEPFDVVVADMRMPKMDGIEFLGQAKAIDPDAVRMMLTGNTDLGTAIAAVNDGNVFRFLTKPCAPEALTKAIAAGIDQHRLITAERDLLTKTLSGSTRLLVELLSMADPVGFGHSLWLRESVRAVTDSLRIPDAWEVVVAAMLSQIGFITLPQELVSKARQNSRLSPEESRMVSRVPEIGSRLLANIPRLESVARIVLYQSKHFDGTAFPEDPVKGRDIPLGARVIMILSDLAGISSWEGSRFKILRHVKERTGWYDPDLLGQVFPLFMPPNAREVESVPVAVSQLRLGQRLCANVERRDGQIIVAAGCRVSPSFLEKIQNFAYLTGVKEPVYVEKDPSPKA